MQLEIDALKIAEANHQLKVHVASPIYELSQFQVIDSSGNDVTSEFYAGIGYEAAFVEGQLYKIGRVSPLNWPSLSQVFREAGIQHLSDAEVTLNAENNVDKIIDFHTKEIELWWP